MTIKEYPYLRTVHILFWQTVLPLIITALVEIIGFKPMLTMLQ